MIIEFSGLSNNSLKLSSTTLLSVDEFKTLILLPFTAMSLMLYEPKSKWFLFTKTTFMFLPENMVEISEMPSSLK